MTGKLTTLLREQADLPDFPALDLGAITTAGDRRVCRRRGAALVGAAAAAAVLAVAVSTAGGRGGDRAVDPADHPFDEARVSWSSGSVIHYGDASVEVGRPIDAFVHTGAGFVVLSDREVWSVTPVGTTRVGTVTEQQEEIVVDPDDGLAGWAEGTGRDRTMVVLDQRTGDLTQVGDSVRGAVALDGRTSYWTGRRGLVATDLTTGKDELLGGSDEINFLAAEDDVVARFRKDGLVISRPGAADVRVPDAPAPVMRFSPGARWLAVLSDHPTVYDVRTGDPVAIDDGGRLYAVAYGWLDDGHLLVAGGRTDAPDATVEVLTCAVPAGTCTTTADVGTTAELGGEHSLPWGYPVTTDGSDAESTDVVTTDPID